MGQIVRQVRNNRRQRTHGTHGITLPVIDPGHIPVLVEPILQLLDPQAGQLVLDCTIGRGGHGEQLIPRIAPGGRYIGLDLDPGNVAFATKRLEILAAKHQVDLAVMHANFTDVRQILNAANASAADVVLADLGFSSNQMDDPRRGLSFQADGPLDMRLDPTAPTTAAELVNRLPQPQLADLLYQLSDERLSRKIARKIVQARHRVPIKSTGELADLVRRAYGSAGGRLRRSRIDPATRTFLSLRIAVNRELEALENLLQALPDLAADGARIGIISFHSQEDRRVKNIFRNWEANGLARRLVRKPVTAEDAERVANPRSRSAKFRAVQWQTAC